MQAVHFALGALARAAAGAGTVTLAGFPDQGLLYDVTSGMGVENYAAIPL